MDGGYYAVSNTGITVHSKLCLLRFAYCALLVRCAASAMHQIQRPAGLIAPSCCCAVRLVCGRGLCIHQVMKLMGKLLEGLKYLHEHGIAHGACSRAAQ